jgi:hypothetical protein
MYRFQTDFGGFMIDRDRRVFRFGERSRAIPLDRLERLDFTQYETKSFAQRWFWMDAACWYQIAVVAAGRRMPLFAVGQVSPRGRIESDADLPADWFPDPDLRARSVLQELREAFRASGRNLSGDG